MLAENTSAQWSLFANIGHLISGDDDCETRNYEKPDL